MTRTRLATLIGVALILGACGGSATPTSPVASTPGAAATTPAAAATTPVAATTAVASATPGAASATPGGQATPPPQGGTGTVVATLTGTTPAGTFTGTGNPNCSFGFLSPGTWGVSFSPNAGDQLQNVVVTAQPGASAGEWAFTAQVSNDPSGSVTWIVSNTGAAGPTIDITDNGPTASLHIVGPLTGSAGTMDLTINCPSVTRV